MTAKEETGSGMQNPAFTADFGDDLRAREPPKPKLILEDLQYSVEEIPPWYYTIFLACQHYLILVGSNLATPILIAASVCTSDPNVTSALLSDMLFAVGFSTVIQTFFGIRLPMVQCTSFAFLIPMNTLTTVKGSPWECSPEGDPNRGEYGNLDWQDRLNTIIGSMMVASAVEVALGATGMISVLQKFIGPLTVAPTIMLMALPAAGTGFSLSGLHWGVAIGVMGLILLFSEVIPIFDITNPCGGEGNRKVKFAVHKMLSVILAVCLMWLLCYILTITDVFPNDENEYGYHARTDIRTHIINEASWFRFPWPGHWGRPKFSAAIFIAMLAGVVSSIIESIGDYYTCARLAGALPPPPHAVNRGIMIEGIDSILSTITGSGYPLTSCSQNISIIDITKVGSRAVVLIAGFMMLVVGCFGKFSAALVTMPDPIIGASFMVLFAVLSAVGASNLQYVNLNSSRNMAVFGMALFMGLGFPSWLVANRGIIDTGSEDFDEIMNVLLANNMFVGSFIALLLDNILPGSLEERGISAWADRGSYEVENTNLTLKTYDFPFGMRFIRRWKWTKYIPFMPTFEGFFNNCSCRSGCCKENTEYKPNSRYDRQHQTSL